MHNSEVMTSEEATLKKRINISEDVFYYDEIIKNCEFMDSKTIIFWEHFSCLPKKDAVIMMQKGFKV